MKREILLPTLALCAVQCLIIALVTHIFPFIAACKSTSVSPCMLRAKLTTAVLLSLNVQPSDVARYSGLAESLISIGDLVFLPLVSIDIPLPGPNKAKLLLAPQTGPDFSASAPTHLLAGSLWCNLSFYGLLHSCVADPYPSRPDCCCESGKLSREYILRRGRKRGNEWTR